jgi:hypothetical protein
LETSVFIGFAFPDDRWESAAKACISSAQKKYTSKTVENEFGKKLEYSVRLIQREILVFLRDMKRRRGTDIVDEATRKRLLAETRDMKIGPFLISVVTGMDPSTTHLSFDEQLRDILHRFLADVEGRKTAIRTWIDHMDIESWLRVDSYETLQQQLRRSIPNHDDVEILLDAHDLASNQKLELAFVTGDWKDIKQHQSQITGSTGIKRIMYLAEFDHHGAA